MIITQVLKWPDPHLSCNGTEWNIEYNPYWLYNPGFIRANTILNTYISTQFSRLRFLISEISDKGAEPGEVFHLPYAHWHHTCEDSIQWSSTQDFLCIVRKHRLYSTNSFSIFGMSSGAKNPVDSFSHYWWLVFHQNYSIIDDSVFFDSWKYTTFLQKLKQKWILGLL